MNKSLCIQKELAKEAFFHALRATLVHQVNFQVCFNTFEKVKLSVKA